jgi:hypothetical protein
MNLEIERFLAFFSRNDDQFGVFAEYSIKDQRRWGRRSFRERNGFGLAGFAVRDGDDHVVQDDPGDVVRFTEKSKKAGARRKSFDGDEGRHVQPIVEVDGEAFAGDAEARPETKAQSAEFDLAIEAAAKVLHDHGAEVFFDAARARDDKEEERGNQSGNDSRKKKPEAFAARKGGHGFFILSETRLRCNQRGGGKRSGFEDFAEERSATTFRVSSTSLVTGGRQISVLQA